MDEKHEIEVAMVTHGHEARLKENEASILITYFQLHEDMAHRFADILLSEVVLSDRVLRFHQR